MALKRKEDSSDGSASKKRKAINMEVKLKIIKRSKNGETPTKIGRSLGLNRSTVATILKDKKRIIEHVKGPAPMKATVITKHRSILIIEMERLLVLWLEDQNQQGVPVSLMVIQEKAKRSLDALKQERGKKVKVKSFRLRGVSLCDLRLGPITITLKCKVKLLVGMRKQQVNFLKRWLR